MTPENNERLLRQLVQSIPRGSISVFDRDLRYLFAEGQGLEQVGLSSELLVGRTLYEVFPKDQVDFVAPYYRRALAGETVAFELPVGEHFYTINAAPLYDGARRVYAVIAVAHNTTERKKAEERLRESEQRFRSIFDQQFQFMAILSPAGVLLDVNELPLRAAGLTRGQVIGRLFWETSWWEGLAEMQAGWPARLAGAALCDGPVFSEDLYRAVDGTRIAAASITAVKNPEGGVEFFIVQASDITERKKAEGRLRESERQLRTLADSIPQLAWMAEADGHIFWYNQRWYDYTGATPAEMEGWGWRSAHDPEMLPRVVERWKASLATGEPFEMEFPLKRADGVFRWFLTRVQPLRDVEGRVVRWFGTNTDVDDQRRAAEGLREANRLKDEFLATLSHELRTPLTAILGWSRMLRVNNLDEAAVARALATIERNARAQVQLIDDLLDTSRIITGKLRLDVRAVDLEAVVAAAVDTVRPAAEAKNIHLQTLLDPQAGPVSGDPDRLQQVVWNLLSNAVKFTPKGGRVQVRLERVNSHVEVTVGDTGKGIAPEFLPHVFDRFRQADQTTTRQHGGLGLGLAIVRQLVELHGGSVHAESPGEGRGATFTVSLPVLPVRKEQESDVPRVHPAARDGVTPDCPPELEGLRVLVVDDEADTRELLTAVLGSCGAQVLTADSAARALEQIELARPDVLVTDIGMPEEDGYALIAKVRRLPAERGGRVPAAALTAYARAEDRVRALRSGFQMHVPKPVEPAELITVVANLAGRTANP